MKYTIFLLFFSLSANAQFSAKLQSFAKQAMQACEEDKSKITGCESYTEVKPLKECLTKNLNKLSPNCKTALKFVK